MDQGRLAGQVPTTDQTAPGIFTIAVDVDGAQMSDLSDVENLVANLRWQMHPDLIGAIVKGLCAVKAHNEAANRSQAQPLELERVRARCYELMRNLEVRRIWP